MFIKPDWFREVGPNVASELAFRVIGDQPEVGEELTRQALCIEPGNFPGAKKARTRRANGQVNQLVRVSL